MEYTVSVNRKGQVSLEFMFILLIMLMYIHMIIIPNIEMSVAAVEDATRLGEARFAAEKLVNAVNYVAFSSGATKQSVSIFVPEGAVLRCENTDGPIQIEIQLSDYLKEYEPGDCQIDDPPDNICRKSFELPQGPTINCLFADIGGANLRTITVEKRTTGEVELI